MDEEQLELVIKKIQMQMHSIQETMVNIGVPVIAFPTFSEFQSSRLYESMVGAPLITSLPIVGPHSQ